MNSVSVDKPQRWNGSRRQGQRIWNDLLPLAGGTEHPNPEVGSLVLLPEDGERFSQDALGGQELD